MASHLARGETLGAHAHAIRVTIRSKLGAHWRTRLLLHAEQSSSNSTRVPPEGPCTHDPSPPTRSTSASCSSDVNAPRSERAGRRAVGGAIRGGKSLATVALLEARQHLLHLYPAPANRDKKTEGTRERVVRGHAEESETKTVSWGGGAMGRNSFKEFILQALLLLAAAERKKRKNAGRVARGPSRKGELAQHTGARIRASSVAPRSSAGSRCSLC